MTFLSDFGLADEYVAVCKAVIRSIAAEVEIFDISHLIQPFGVREGATVLAESVSYFPEAVHLAVVDPGVGSSRRALVLATSSGALMVGPDNGLLIPSADRLGGVVSAHRIANPRLGLAGRSSTFHGRDVFAPAAAHLCNGVPLEEFGPGVEPESLVMPAQGAVERSGDHFRGEILLIDRFGNLQTNFRRSELEALGLLEGDPAQVTVGTVALTAVVRSAYSLGADGEVQVVEDSHGCLSLCVNRASAAELAGGVHAGSAVLLGKPAAAPGRDPV